ncbi:MAG: hypothetical protein AAF127_15610 [Pseudomonadota bacterium]
MFKPALTAAASALALALVAAPQAAQAQRSIEVGSTGVEGERVGTEHMVFDTGIEGPAHKAFLRGLALLHSFEYGRAAAAFRESQEAAPDFVMAYWGEAMTHNHPLWAEQDREAARAILARLAPTPAGRRAKARTQREAMWLDAVETLYGEGGTKQERDHLYLAKMQAMLAADPSDIDARAFTGLAILGTSHGGRDVAIYMQAAGVLEPGFMTHGQHPGILHYLIHSYDDPVHAPLGERMAARYATIAPDAGHAQHMVSHIYHALGDWEASESANVKAVAAANAARGFAYHCGHYNEWLVYALVQQGKDARDLVAACRDQAAQELASTKSPATSIAPRSAATSYARIALYSGVTSLEWSDSLDWPEDQFRLAQFGMANARLLQASDDAEAVRAALAELKQVHTGILAVLPTELPAYTGIEKWNARAIAQGEAIALLASGETEAGLTALRAAAEAEEALPVVFGPPIIAKPSWELLGEHLLKAGRKDEAALAFRNSLAFAPKRRLSLAGLEAASAP